MLPRVWRLAGHSFLPRGLAGGGLVIDGGANLGAFALPLRRRGARHLLCVEPVPALAASLEASGLAVARVALAATPGQLTLKLYRGTCASLDVGPRDDLVAEIEVEGVTLEMLIERHGGRAALLKLDIEGAECALLLQSSDTVLRAIGQITVEFHDFLDARLAPQVTAAIDRLRGLGFEVFRFSRDNSDVLFVNPALLPLGRFARLYLRQPYRLARGLLRRVARRLGWQRGWEERAY